MKGYLQTKGTLIVGSEMILESSNELNTYGSVFEDDGDTGYFYALDYGCSQPIVDAVHVYNCSNVIDGAKPSSIQILWSLDSLKTALVINSYIHAVFDFSIRRGYCRTGFPPITTWSSDGHDWDDEAIGLFE